jgi:hypothetical protein
MPVAARRQAEDNDKDGIDGSGGADPHVHFPASDEWFSI